MKNINDDIASRSLQIHLIWPWKINQLSLVPMMFRVGMSNLPPNNPASGSGVK